MAEVNRQMEPIKDMLAELHDWQLAFWSNGSGRVPGFFQRRIQDDDRWRETVEDHKSKVDTLIGDLCKAREFREKREEEEKERKQKRREFWMGIFWKAGLPFILFVVSAAAAGVVKAAPVIKILWDDYLRAHPQVTERLKNTADSGDPSYADGEQPQHASW